MLENRNKDLTYLHKGADYLSRALRENLRVLSVDSQEKSTQFISENNVVISCNYNHKDDKLVFTNFVFETVDDFVSDKKIDNEIKGTISSFVNSLHEDRYDKADVSFDDLISLFETRSTLDSERARVEKTASVFGDQTRIMESKEFHKLQEVKPLFTNFLREPR